MTAMPRRHRYRPSVGSRPHAPSAPHHRHRPERVPHSDLFYDWLPEKELVVGVSPRTRDSAVFARLAALYAPSKPKGEAE
jgi:hypothetical protein